MKIRFYVTERNKLHAMWVAPLDRHPVLGDRNIWDLKPKECTPDVLHAIRSAFYRGVEFHKELMRNSVAESIIAEDGWEDYCGKGK